MTNLYKFSDTRSYIKVSNRSFSIEATDENARIITYACAFMIVCVGISALMSK